MGGGRAPGREGRGGTAEAILLLLLASPLTIYWLAQLDSAWPIGLAFLVLIGGFVLAMLSLEEKEK
jgi:hypothetical protein